MAGHDLDNLDNLDMITSSLGIAEPPNIAATIRRPRCGLRCGAKWILCFFGFNETGLS